jgi:hypothetical protein
MRGAAPERVANAGANEYQCEVQPPSMLPTSGRMNTNARRSPRAYCQRWGEYMSGSSETPKRVG